jgi:hypothetical protein
MTLAESYFLFFYLQLASYAFPIWVGIRYFRHLDNRLKLFFLGILIACCIDVTSWVMYKLHIHNHYLDYFFSFNGFITKLLIYRLFIKNPTHKKIIIGIGLLIIPLFLVDVVWVSGTEHHNAFSGGASQLWVFVATFYCFRQLIHEHPVGIRKQPFFWIFMGILIKVGLTYFDTVAYNFILSSSVPLTYLLSDFTYLTCVIENILYATGLRHGKKE